MIQDNKTNPPKAEAKPKDAKPNRPSKPELRRRRLELPKAPVLRFSPTAWAKLLFFRDRGETEIGGFGIAEADDLLLIRDFVTVKQNVTVASISFDDLAVADFFDSQVDAGKKPEQIARCWLHSHPGDSPQPSSTDEETFQRVFGKCQWAVMFILAQNDRTYARLRFNIGPGGQAVIPVEVDYSKPFGPSDHEAWEAEYQANIKIGAWNWGLTCDEPETPGSSTREALSGSSVPNDWLEELETMDPAERRMILDELAVRPDLWDETEVGYAY